MYGGTISRCVTSLPNIKVFRMRSGGYCWFFPQDGCKGDAYNFSTLDGCELWSGLTKPVKSMACGNFQFDRPDQGKQAIEYVDLAELSR